MFTLLLIGINAILMFTVWFTDYFGCPNVTGMRQETGPVLEHWQVGFTGWISA